MTTTQLKYFIAVAKLRSFTKAAEQFYITQTAMTQQIQALEEQIGCALFDRTTRPVSLTPAGNAFFLDARAILERMETSLERAKEASTGMVGSLKVGFLRGYERSNLSDILCSFHKQYPNILVSLYRNATDVLAASLMNHELDLIVTWDSTNLIASPAAEGFLMDKAKLVVALYANHPLANKKVLHRSELKDEKILYMSPSEVFDSYGDSVFMNLYQRAGFKPNILFQTSDAESILIMVAAEEGVSILPDYCTNKLTNAENLVFVPLEGEGEVEEISAIWRKDNGNPVLARLTAFLQENKNASK